MELWTGLVCLVPDPACKNFKRFGDGKGAYVNVVAWAESAKHFERRVRATAKEQLKLHSPRNGKDGITGIDPATRGMPR